MFWIFLVQNHRPLPDVLNISSLFIFLIPNHRPLGQCFEYFLPLYLYIKTKEPMIWIFLHFLSFSFQITDHSADVFIISSLFIFLIPNHRPLGQCFEYFLPLYLYIKTKEPMIWIFLHFLSFSFQITDHSAFPKSQTNVKKPTNSNIRYCELFYMSFLSRYVNHSDFKL